MRLRVGVVSRHQLFQILVEPHGAGGTLIEGNQDYRLDDYCMALNETEAGEVLSCLQERCFLRVRSTTQLIPKPYNIPYESPRVRGSGSVSMGDLSRENNF